MSLAKRLGIPDGVPNLGPLRGQLANGGDTVALYKPDPPQGLHHDDAGFVPYIVVDRLTYGDTAPWPSEADGQGTSLQRLAANQFANDPVNWKAAAPNPGRDNRPSDGNDSDNDGIPDDWETAHGLDPLADADAHEDIDRDGLSNLAEYYAGTDPQDAASVFQLLAKRLANRRIELNFNAARGGQVVEVQSTDALGQVRWETVMEQVAEAAGPQQVEVDVSNSGSQFFRLLLTE